VPPQETAEAGSQAPRTGYRSRAGISTPRPGRSRHIQLGNVVIPKSVTPSRIEENFRLFDFDLGDEEMQRLSELDRGERIGPDPDTFVKP